MRRLLERMARIERMERGKICRMAGRAQHNHQTWRGGRNVVRYVPADRVASLQEAIDGYALFTQLTEQYADAVIARTRAKRAQTPPPKKRRPRPTASRQESPKAPRG
jgi:hypothetical protein